MSNQGLSRRNEFPASFEQTQNRWSSEAHNLHSVIRVLLRRRRWIVGAVIFCTSLAIAFNVISKPLYEATATVELNHANSSTSFGLNDMMTDQSFSDIGAGLETDLQTETSILKSDSLALDVISDLNLASQPPFIAPVRKGKNAQLPWKEDPAQRARLVNIFESHLIVAPVRGTRLIQASFKSGDPKQAATVANALIESYKAEYLQSRYSATSEASDWLTKQLSDLKANVETSEKRLTEFEKQSGILNLQAEAGPGNGESSDGVVHSPVIQKLETLNSDLTAAETNRIQKEAIYRLARDGNADAIIALANNPSAQAGSSVLAPGGGLENLQFLQQKKLGIKTDLAQALNVYGPNNRHLKELELQLNTINGQISQELQSLVRRAQADLQLAQETEDQIRQRFDHQQNAASKLNEKTVQLALLSQEANSRRKLYDDLYTKLQEANVAAGIKATNITVVDPARPEPVPVSPRRMRNLELGILLGVLLGIGLAYLVDGIDRTVVSFTEVEDLTDASVLAIIPQFHSTGRNSRRSGISANANGAPPAVDLRLLILNHPDSAEAEAFRSLRTSVMLSRPNGGPRVLLITSCIPGEGKSTVTANLALTFAQHGKKVLIVEADMRRPSMRHVLDVSNDAGLSSVLAGSSTFASAVLRSVQVDGLDVLPAGPRPPLPSELLGSAAFDELLDMLRASYDLIVIDSPPALMLTDAVSIANKTDAVIWVVRSGAVTRPLLSRAVQVIHRSRMPVIGFLLNGITRDVDPYGYSYEYGYGYKAYGSYYGSKESDHVQK